MKKFVNILRIPSKIGYRTNVSRAFCSTKEEDSVVETVVKNKEVHFNSLSPHQKWLAFGKGIERPFTGLYWDTENVGSYNCSTCSSEIFK